MEFEKVFPSQLDKLAGLGEARCMATLSSLWNRHSDEFRVVFSTSESP